GDEAARTRPGFAVAVEQHAQPPGPGKSARHPTKTSAQTARSGACATLPTALAANVEAGQADVIR
ncbi:MAG TPA: hypothetical protein VNT24_05375, partial [Propionibacteriaceae bacterium]|nr:hypothetical protein [Propionibacteriaceae bacterium]